MNISEYREQQLRVALEQLAKEKIAARQARLMSFERQEGLRIH